VNDDAYPDPDNLSTAEMVHLTLILKQLNDALDEYGFGQEISFREIARLARLGADTERGES
jgi:hypothetical protein